MSTNSDHYLERLVEHVSNLRECVAELATSANWAARPSVLYRPTLFLDGNQWCALYGANLQEGIAGFGDTPADAMRRFDTTFMSQKAPQPLRETVDRQCNHDELYMVNADGTCLLCGVDVNASDETTGSNDASA